MKPPATTSKEGWPPNYVGVYAWRARQIERMRKDPNLLAGALAYYGRGADGCVDFINHWVDTYDPRKPAKGMPARLPLVMFPRQEDLVRLLFALIEGEANGLVEKSRDMGATWVCGAVSVWLWLFFGGASIGWGSRKEILVDRSGDPDSIFEKLRMIVRGVPRMFLPMGFDPGLHMSYMRIVNPETGATITGEAGDNIGRGGRKLVYFKDESAHYARPEVVEAALSDNTNVAIDISSVHGLGNVFHRRRESGVEWTGGPVAESVANVLVMDWSDHPEKDEAWHARRRKKAEADGLLHVFEQEVNRNYSASVEGVLIPAEWVRSAIDAHLTLGFPPGGARIAGLDVADEGADKNALVDREGPVMLSADDWPEGDVGKTARRAVTSFPPGVSVEIQYDCIGVGAGVKAEANRLTAEGLMPAGLSLVAWSASAAVLDPDERILKNEDGTPDINSPTNRDFYKNLRAQGAWQLRLRFERTHRAVTEGVVYDPDDLISIPRSLPKRRQLEKELSQVTYTRSTGSLKLTIVKAPEGTRSPNLFDATVKAYWPIPATPDFEWFVGG